MGSVSSCFPTEMRIVVNLTKNPDLVVSEMHLIDTNCKVTDNNETHARFDIPLNDCGTTRDGSNPDYIEFSNAVKWSPKPVGNELQTRKYDFESRIICRYDRNGSASVSIKPEQEITVSQTGMMWVSLCCKLLLVHLFLKLRLLAAIKFKCICFAVGLFVCQPVYVPVLRSFYRCVRQSIWLIFDVGLAVYLSISESTCLFVRLYVSQSICLSHEKVGFINWVVNWPP